MLIKQLKLNGFRNFKSAVINVNEKTLIIGANDIGKSNMLHAMRILLDRSFSDLDIEPRDSDFYVHEETSELSIIIKFEGVKEDCVVSKLKGYISDNGELFLAYKAWKTNKEYKFYAGHSENALEEIQERYYRKVLHLKYIGSNRDLYTYIKKEKRNLLKEAKNKRNEGEVVADDAKITQIQGNLNNANENIAGLSYISRATESINTELKELSFHHTGQEVVFDVGGSDVNSFVENLHLSSKVNNRNLLIGGDGRNNQIFLALWAARNEIQEENPLEVVFYCIEEPEAHLHPHQQRKLSEYLVKTLKGQVFITSHSPQIASEFSPNSIVRLLSKDKQTQAASYGCSEIIEKSIQEFGYRLNIISSESFFANVVLLVEGPSEIIFYKLLARSSGIDLDRLNISILMADGIGFSTFTKVLSALEIKWVIRTDNDIFKIPKKNEYRLAGVERLIDIYNSSCIKSPATDKIIAAEKANLRGFSTSTPPAQSIESAKKISDALMNNNLFLSNIDLENDLLNQGLFDSIKEFLEIDDKHEMLTAMQKRKATFMFEYVSKKNDLSKLSNSDLLKPLTVCKNLAEIF